MPFAVAVMVIGIDAGFAMVDAKGETATDAIELIRDSYATGVMDEFVLPHVLLDESGDPVGQIQDGDGIFFWNFRSDRARELTWAFKQKDFNRDDFFHVVAQKVFGKTAQGFTDNKDLRLLSIRGRQYNGQNNYTN